MAIGTGADLGPFQKNSAAQNEAWCGSYIGVPRAYEWGLHLHTGGDTTYDAHRKAGLLDDARAQRVVRTAAHHDMLACQQFSQFGSGTHDYSS